MSDLTTYYSQTKQDFFIDRLFRGKRKGVFVDIGAHDGVTLSNTYFFEKERDWTGICIEPVPEVFEKLQNNRTCCVVNAAISDSTEKLEFKRVHGYSEMLSGISKFRDEAHDLRTNREIAEKGGNVEVIEVQAVRLDELLLQNKLSKIHYLSLDIEGGEYEVLASINFKKSKIDSLTVENNYNSARIRRHMKEQGYLHVFRYKVDDFYIKPSKLIAALLIKEFRSFILHKIKRRFSR